MSTLDSAAVTPDLLGGFDRLGLDYNGADRPTGLAPQKLLWLFHILRAEQVRRSLEIGFGLGISAAAMLHAGVEEHMSIEVSPGRLAVAEANVAKARRPEQHFRLLQGRSDWWLPALVRDGESFDLMLVDGGHRFDDVFVDAHFAQRLLRRGGILLLDDSWLNAVRSVASWFSNNLPHIWEPVPPPPEFARLPDLSMLAFQRSGVTETDEPGGRRPWNRHRRFETFEDQN